MWTRTGHVAVSVTEQHIEKAMQRNSSHCAVALAIAESVRDAKFIAVDLQSIRFTRRGLRYCFLTPRAAQACIVNFDQGLRDLIKPFDFSMRPAFIVPAGQNRHRTPTNGELRGSGLSVSKKQMHLPDDQQQPVEEKPGKTLRISGESCPKRERVTKDGERNLDPNRSDGLAPPPMRMPDPERQRQRARAKVSTASKGSVPVSLGGRLPPVSVLSRREFGLRALRR
jgi:hypothetical protein